MNNPLNKVVLSVVVYDKIQPKTKHRVLGKIEFHLHKLVKVRAPQGSDIATVQFQDSCVWDRCEKCHNIRLV